nr:hypothetical protein [Tanacetum cinerariifolium]
MMRLVVEIDFVGMIADVVDKVTYSFDGWQLKQVDMKYIHALNEPHLHDICVVPNRHEVDQHGLTPVEDNASLLETRFDEEAVFVFVFPENVTGSVNLTLLALFIGVTATNLLHKLLTQGQSNTPPDSYSAASHFGGVTTTIVEVPKELPKVSMAVKQHCVEKNKFQDKMKDVLKENERLLEQAMSTDIVNTAVNANVNYACKTVNDCEC